MAKVTKYSAYRLSQNGSFRQNVSNQATLTGLNGSKIFAKSTTGNHAFCTAKNKQPKILNNGTTLYFGAHECALKINNRYGYSSQQSFTLTRLPDKDESYIATTPTCKITLAGVVTSSPCWATVSEMQCEVYAPFSYEVEVAEPETKTETGESENTGAGESGNAGGSTENKGETSGGGTSETENKGSGSTLPPTNPQSPYFNLKEIAMFVKLGDTYYHAKSLKVEDKKVIVIDSDGISHEKASTKSASALHSAICQALRHSGNLLNIDAIV